MERKFQITYAGQAVDVASLNTMGESAALADDRVFAELFRLTPFDTTVARGIIAATGSQLVQNAGPTGSVLVNPFRAVIGSRTLPATDGRKSYRDIRSSLSIADGAVLRTQLVALAANASGFPRWDLIYAIVDVDAPTLPTFSRKVKDPSTSVVASQTVSPTAQTNVTLAVLAGTPAASPAFPAVPADSTTYKVPLAYVRVPNGFTVADVVNPYNIDEVAPILSIAPQTGASSQRPASGNSRADGAGLQGTGSSINGAQSWTATNGTRPGAFLPPAMVGGETLLIALDLSAAAPANWSHQNGDIVDDTRDWRNRMFRWDAAVGSALGAQSASAFPWANGTGQLFHAGLAGAGNWNAFGYATSIDSPTAACGMGFSANIAGGAAPIARICASGAGSVAAPGVGANVCTNAMQTATAVGLYADLATGVLRVSITGIPRISCAFWLSASAQYPNR